MIHRCANHGAGVAWRKIILLPKAHTDEQVKKLKNFSNVDHYSEPT